MQEIDPKALAFGATDTEKTFPIHEDGLINSIVLTLPDFTTAATATISIKNKNGDAIYTSAAKNKNVTSLITGLAIPCMRGFTGVITLNAEAGGDGGNVTTQLYVENRR